MSIFSLLKREISRQFIRFCIIGLESTVLNDDIKGIINPNDNINEFFETKMLVFKNKKW